MSLAALPHKKLGLLRPNPQMLWESMEKLYAPYQSATRWSLKSPAHLHPEHSHVPTLRLSGERVYNTSSGSVLWLLWLFHPALLLQLIQTAPPARSQLHFGSILYLYFQHSLFVFEFRHSVFVFVLLSSQSKPPQPHVLMICSRIVFFCIMQYSSKQSFCNHVSNTQNHVNHNWYKIEQLLIEGQRTTDNWLKQH